MKIKTSELTGPALDWSVAKCEGYQSVYTNGSLRPVFRKCKPIEGTWPNYSTDWSQGGPIIEREKIKLNPQEDETSERWSAFHTRKGGRWFYARSSLTAAMRCYVASKMGDEVEIPEELL